MSILDRMIGRYEPPYGVEAMKVLHDETGPLPKLFRFFCMQAEAITGNLNVADGMLLLKVFGTEFVENCFRVVAGAFSDTNADQNVAEEIKAVDQMIDVMEQRFLEEVEVLRKRQETQEETKNED